VNDTGADRAYEAQWIAGRNYQFARTQGRGITDRRCGQFDGCRLKRCQVPASITLHGPRLRTCAVAKFDLGLSAF
jgi:hypothetical protein